MEDEKYVKGFNQGYLLQKHKPDLAEQLKTALKESNNDRDQGFLDGAKEYELEALDKYVGQKKNYSHQNLLEKKDPEKEPGMEKD